MVQWDILFHRDVMISHCIDEAIRWTSAVVLKDRETTTIIAALMDSWVRPYGTMQLLVTDREGAMVSDLAAQWRDRYEIEVRLKEVGSHANIVG